MKLLMSLIAISVLGLLYKVKCSGSNNIDIIYNTKKPSYKKIDLIELAQKLNVIGADRLTIPLLEQSILSKLSGYSIEQKAKSLNIVNDNLTSRGYIVAIMEKLTNKM